MAGAWDLYREVHKGMRLALASVTTRAGSADAGDERAVRALLEEWRDVALVMRGHHDHEDEFCDPLIRGHAPELRDVLEEGHRRVDRHLKALDRSVERIRSTVAGDRVPLLLRFHLDLTDLAACYLPHLAYEERIVMPALNAALSDRDLEAVTVRIRSSVPATDMCVFIRYMVPAMDFTERLGMLGGMYAEAPPDVFEMFRATAQAALIDQEYEAVALAAGFA